MEKMGWKQVRFNDRNGQQPNQRWGHSCTTIDDDVVYFGGYADSTYMNDLWAFNTITMEWREVITTGEVPSYRSNCAMHYDPKANRVVVFGGGGANKRRFNTMNVLDWTTKEWSQIEPKAEENAPWERTYHTAEMFYPYLVVFGGQGVADLDDLWVYHLQENTWREVPIGKNAVRPCARRFHASAKVGNEFFVIAGCYQKYRCLSDIYSIDLTTLVETGQLDRLEWRERKMKDSTFLTRWGHTATVHQDKIYVFGGRFCNDLNDILVLDPASDQVTTLKVHNDIPKARRRHSACFLGSSMLIFGGFNGEYFNDLHYINVHNVKKRLTTLGSITHKDVKQVQIMPGVKTISIKTKEGTEVKAIEQLLKGRFIEEDGLQQFIQGVTDCYTQQELKQLLLDLYRGYGPMSQKLREKYGVQLYESKPQMDYQFKQQVTQEGRMIIGSKKRIKAAEPVIYLEDEQYSEYLEEWRENCKGNLLFNVNEEAIFKGSRARISLNSSYWRHLLSNGFQEGATKQVFIPFPGSLLFETVLYYLTHGFVVVYHDVDHIFWLKIAELAEYYALSHLSEVSEQELIGCVTEDNCQDILIRSIDLGLRQLSVACAEKIIKTMVNRQLEDQSDIFPEVHSVFLAYEREKVLKNVYALLRFDILQRKIDQEYKENKNSAKTIDSEADREEKENELV